ncbi:unnamed protein product [Durusdinium trenchii]|uniref:Uncharacterized protein n=1 Tax=Durusdinium trenchii TaxID=1381693 RepID=A0ABP0K8Y8_9DINO
MASRFRTQDWWVGKVYETAGAVIDRSAGAVMAFPSFLANAAFGRLQFSDVFSLHLQHLGHSPRSSGLLMSGCGLDAFRRDGLDALPMGGERKRSCDDAESPKSNDREAEDDSPKSPTIEGVLQWDPIAISKSEGDSALCELSWDPLGLSMTCTTTEGGGGCLDPSVVLLAARTLDKKTTSDCVKRASFYSLPSTAFSETATTDKDDEADSVFEAWAVTEALGSPDDILMHKGVHYEMSVRNTFISFGVAGTAKRMLQRSLSEPSLNERED